METRRITIGQSNSPLRAILEVEDDTRVVAVLRPNGSVMEYKDIPQWVMMDIRHRGMVYVGDVLLNTQTPVTPNQPPITPSKPTQHKCKNPCIVTAIIIGILIVIGAVVPDTSDDTTAPAARTRTSNISTPAIATPTPLPTSTPTPITYATVGEILRTFQANPARGKIDYMQSPVYVKGTVRSFNLSDSRVVYLTSEGSFDSNDYEVFLVRYPTLEEAAALSIGDTLRLLCKISQGYAFPHGYEIECAPR